MTTTTESSRDGSRGFGMAWVSTRIRWTASDKPSMKQSRITSKPAPRSAMSRRRPTRAGCYGGTMTRSDDEGWVECLVCALRRANTRDSHDGWNLSSWSAAVGRRVRQAFRRRVGGYTSRSARARPASSRSPPGRPHHKRRSVVGRLASLSESASRVRNTRSRWSDARGSTTGPTRTRRFWGRQDRLPAGESKGYKACRVRAMSPRGVRAASGDAAVRSSRQLTR